MATEFWDDILAFSKDMTAAIGEHLLAKYGQVEATRKEDGSLVTEADKWADNYARAAIAKRFPDHGAVTEETEHIWPDTDWCWAIDPIDGTTNYTWGLPVWGTSVGLLYRGTPVFGYVHFPTLKQSFYGYWYGDSGLSGPTGAYCNGRPIQTSSDDPNYSHIFIACARSNALMAKPFPCKFRMVGTCAYSFSLTASGAAIGSVEVTPKIWDIAAVWAIVQAAGGAFVSLEPKPIFPLQVGVNYGQRSFPSLVVARAELVPQFKPLVEFLGLLHSQ
ncbi:MAG: inositol monophosphatase family protein [Cyanobacteria bacterium J06641_5]